jgi:hypothetical protein
MVPVDLFEELLKRLCFRVLVTRKTQQGTLYLSTAF